ncbi:DUF3492 domain-containing protein [Streptomyces sp. TRM66268-LWL]|uniref:D-inositol 3-phosphate glycosyltransferase n=1 Tax=Streptomyces polyasparticus TaxID=2767826 RepID=A0ABR7S6M6_9ACTN|nr:DUF3492 domain-containing protein [Streptomyces polyasparticus]MBC9711126.1 DUF3492 domain-containing protein [Streptomyces polyasparticus]
MRIGLLTEGGYPYVTGEARLWCDRLVRGLDRHEFDIFALSRSAHQEEQGWIQLPPQVHRVRTAPLWTAEDDGVVYGRRARRRFATHWGELAAAVCAEGETAADRFANALYGLADLEREEGGLAAALRSEAAVDALEKACRAPGAPRAARQARVADLLTVTGLIERTLRPLSLDWYEEVEGGLGAVDLCHAASGGAAALPGLLAKHFYGVPLLVTEYGVQLRAHYLGAAGALSAPARALLAGFHGRLATEVYRQAALITPGNTHARRWQERCGADKAKLRTVYPGMEVSRFAEVGESADLADPDTLVWVGRIEPSKDLIALLHAFAEVRKEEPKVRLRIIGAPADGPEAATYLAHCTTLAAQLFPDEAEGVHAVGDNPVSFEEIGGPEVPELADAYAAGSVVVLSSVVEGFPISLVEAMFCGRATVSTDVGAVVEVIGGTGLVVPPRNPRALADACLALLRDPERRDRLGAAARARALELFTVDQNIAAFRSIYLEIVARHPVRREGLDESGEPQPFANPAEVFLPGRWGPSGRSGLEESGASGPSWAADGAAAEASQPAEASTDGVSDGDEPVGVGAAGEGER